MALVAPAETRSTQIQHNRGVPACSGVHPLWALLLQAVPDARLPAQLGTPRSASYRLHRCVIEIRDAELAQRPYQDDQTIDAAADAASAAGLRREEHDAVIEAVMIVTALDAHRAGAQPHCGAAAMRALTEPRNELESETVRLLLVSRALRHSTIVRQAVRSARSRSVIRRPA